ncbi:hypothetical protein EHF33_03110 [Deinococcus psychrotolerans]|uniref:Lipoprotein n=1 Tax=Deinococcus psychrotolerans TaxID=2489213 RepID=A0A3G8YHD1_9DEIO|nr:hypothetical protein [Deinococcus psychrotolerans]AZI41864.1 hypothetical protein EHF33_03110 [Deinococcus psychrotolerans]
MKLSFIYSAMIAPLLFVTACGPTSTSTPPPGSGAAKVKVKVAYDSPEEINVAPDPASYGKAYFKLNVSADRPSVLFFSLNGDSDQDFTLLTPRTPFDVPGTQSVLLSLYAKSTATLGKHSMEMVVLDYTNFVTTEIARVPIQFNVIGYDAYLYSSLLKSGETNLLPLVITGFKNYSGPMEIKAVDLPEGITAKPLLIQFKGGVMNVDYPVEVERKAAISRQQLTLTFKSGGMNFKIKDEIVITPYEK